MRIIGAKFSLSTPYTPHRNLFLLVSEASSLKTEFSGQNFIGFKVSHPITDLILPSERLSNYQSRL
jgi:hypothetical protein